MAGSAPLPGREAFGRALALADAVDRAVGALCRLVILVAGLALLGVLGANVVARYALASGGFRFAQELPERIFPWFIMAGVALAVQHGGHMAVDAILPRLGQRGARALLLVGHAIVVVAYAVLFGEALQVASIMSIDRSPVLGLPSSYGYYALAAGCLAVMVTTLTVAVRVAVHGPGAMPVPKPEEAGT